jgi:acyl-CoA reductase-like NAD-dependent aldehyde dehydrogenase
MASKPLDFQSFPGNIINGQITSTSSTRSGINPTTSEKLWPVPVTSKEDLDTAVVHARKAFKTWSQTTYKERGTLLSRYADAIEAQHEELERLNTLETGKAISLSRAEVAKTVDYLRNFATMELADELIEDTEERSITSTFVPLGIVGALIPWNWPALLGLSKVGIALMTGNVAIAKPSPLAPYTILKLAELASPIFPPGVFQALSGGDELGPWMTEHPDIDMITFTGSTATGKRVAASCSKTLKRTILELGGNDAAIVCDDVDMATALPKIAGGAFVQSGQICMNIKRIYIHDRIYDQFRDAMVGMVKDHFPVGDPLDENVFFGPLQSQAQFDSVKKFYDEAEEQGLRHALRGGPLEGQDTAATKGGYFLTPTIIDDPPRDSRVVTEEPFGPIVPLLRWSNEDEVVAEVNDSNLGLGASVWSKDLARAERMARRLEAGSVWVNSHFDVAANVPTGGFKESGIGRENGIEGFKNYTNSRSLWVWKKVFAEKEQI